MDYEVFILARMREEYDHSGSTDVAVVHGIGRTGRLVTAQPPTGARRGGCSPHAAIARWNAGEPGLSPGPTGNIIPRSKSASPVPERASVGSGKLGMPWLRMHLASASAASFWLSDGAGGGPPPG
jgi:hypothetical protein